MQRGEVDERRALDPLEGVDVALADARHPADRDPARDRATRSRRRSTRPSPRCRPARPARPSRRGRGSASLGARCRGRTTPPAFVPSTNAEAALCWSVRRRNLGRVRRDLGDRADEPFVAHDRILGRMPSLEPAAIRTSWRNTVCGRTNTRVATAAVVVGEPRAVAVVEQLRGAPCSPPPRSRSRSPPRAAPRPPSAAPCSRPSRRARRWPSRRRPGTGARRARPRSRTAQDADADLAASRAAPRRTIRGSRR